MAWYVFLVPVALALCFEYYVPAEFVDLPGPLKRIIKRFKSFFQGAESKSQALMKAIFDLERQLQSGRLAGQFELPQYKTYTALLNNLLSSQRRYGVPLGDALAQMREFLKQEGSFSRKWTEEKRGGQLQLVLMSFISWVFIKTSLSILESGFSWRLLSFIAAAHLSGIFIYRHGLYKISVRFFEKLLIFQEVVFRFRVYRRSGLPTKLILQEVAPGDLEGQGGALSSLREQLFELIQQWRESGISIEAELKGLEDEIGLRLELNRDKALKWEKALRLLVLLLFYVIPYLSYLFSLLSSLR